MSAILARSSRNQKRSAIAIDFARRWRVARVETPATQPCKYAQAIAGNGTRWCGWCSQTARRGSSGPPGVAIRAGQRQTSRMAGYNTHMDCFWYTSTGKAVSGL
eukprot:1052769-Rhodomonas_salina.2